MKKLILPLYLLCSGYLIARPQAVDAPSAQSAQRAMQPATTNSLIYVVDMDRCMRESIMGKEKSSQIEQLERKFATRSQELEANLKNMAQEIEQKAPMMAPDALAKKRKEFERARDDFASEMQEMRMQYEQIVGAVSQEMNEFIMPIKKTVSDKLGGAAIADKRMFLESGSLPDCTDLFIAEMDAVYKKQQEAAKKADSTGKSVAKSA